MASDQDWCTQCGNRADHRRRTGAGLLSAGALVALSAVLATTAAAAGIAALTESSVKEPSHTRLALVPPPVTVATTTSAPVSPATPTGPQTVGPGRHAGRLATSSSSSTTSSTTTTTASSTTTTTATSVSRPVSRTTTTTTTGSAQQQEGPELEGVTAAAYSNSPLYQTTALEEGEAGQGVSRAVEGPESETAWQIGVISGTAKHMNFGLMLQLHAPTRVGSVEVHTTTPGFRLEVFATSAATVPASITEWKLIGSVAKLKHRKTIKLTDTTTAWRRITLWIPKVPASQTHVSLGEVALFAP